MDLDTFMTTLYVVIDDWYKREMRERMVRHAGPRLQMSDSEVLTIAVAGQWRVGVPWRSERGVVRYMLAHGQEWFPTMLKRSQFNQRVRDLWSALVCLQQDIANLLMVDDLYEVVDCTELPHCSLSQAASYDAHWLSGELGRGGNNGGWFWGEQLLVSVSASGLVTGWLVGLAAIDDRWMMQAFLSTRHGFMDMLAPQPNPKKEDLPKAVATCESFSPAITAGCGRGLPYLVDDGFNGDRWIDHWSEEYGIDVIASPPQNAKNSWSRADKKWLSHHRQIIETVFSRLSETFGLKRLNAHSDWGKLTRLAAKMASYNMGVLLNRLLGRPSGAVATLLC